MPYLAILGLDKLVCNLGIEKTKSISTLQNVLTLIFLAVIGKKRVIKVEKVKDHGIAVLAGLSKLPSKSALYGFLDQITVACAEKFEIACAKAFKKQGIFNGKTVNLDGHLISYFGDLKIGKDKHPTRNTIMRGIKAFIIQDQDTGNPVFGRVEYPRKGLKPETVAVPLLEIARNILPNLEKVVFDKWFSVGSLLEYLDKKMNLKYVTLIKLYNNRIEEMKSIRIRLCLLLPFRQSLNISYGNMGYVYFSMNLGHNQICFIYGKNKKKEGKKKNEKKRKRGKKNYPFYLFCIYISVCSSEWTATCF